MDQVGFEPTTSVLIGVKLSTTSISKGAATRERKRRTAQILPASLFFHSCSITMDLEFRITRSDVLFSCDLLKQHHP